MNTCERTYDELKTILENDAYVNKTRVEREKLPIIWRGTNTNELEEISQGSLNRETYWAFNPIQALSFAEINGKSTVSVMLKIDLEELVKYYSTGTDRPDVKISPEECIIKGCIPRECVEAFILVS